MAASFSCLAASPRARGRRAGTDAAAFSDRRGRPGRAGSETTPLAGAASTAVGAFDEPSAIAPPAAPPGERRFSLAAMRPADACSARGVSVGLSVRLGALLRTLPGLLRILSAFIVLAHSCHENDI